VSNRGDDNPVPDGVIDKIPPQYRGGSVFRIVEFLPDKELHRSAQEMAGGASRASVCPLHSNPASNFAFANRLARV
jgi:hypothetical protein